MVWFNEFYKHKNKLFKCHQTLNDSKPGYSLNLNINGKMWAAECKPYCCKCFYTIH